MFWCRDFKNSVNHLLFAWGLPLSAPPENCQPVALPPQTHLNSCLMENCETLTVKFSNSVGADVEKVRKFQN